MKNAALVAFFVAFVAFVVAGDAAIARKESKTFRQLARLFAADSETKAKTRAVDDEPDTMKPTRRFFRNTFARRGMLPFRMDGGNKCGLDCRTDVDCLFNECSFCDTLDSSFVCKNPDHLLL